MKQHGNHENGPAGFSLPELLIVVAILTIITTFAVQGFARIQKEWSLLGSARMLETSLHWGRMRAITSNAPVLFEIEENGRGFMWRDPATGNILETTARSINKGSLIVSSPRTPLRFYPRGNAVPSGTYTIEGETGSYSVVVAPGGRIRLQKN